MIDELRDHLHAIAARTHDARVLSAATPWDCTEPVALDWVRRWGPQPMGVALPECGCRVGRCVLCN
jgi:hypothetical protein